MTARLSGHFHFHLFGILYLHCYVIKVKGVTGTQCRKVKGKHPETVMILRRFLNLAPSGSKFNITVALPSSSQVSEIGIKCH